MGYRLSKIATRTGDDGTTGLGDGSRTSKDGPRIDAIGQVGFRFFGQLILDCLNRTEKAMTQAHAFKAAELCLRAQLAARKIA